MEYRWSDALGTPWASMAITTKLSDGTAQDITTGEGVTVNAAATSHPACSHITAAPRMIAQIYLGTQHSLTGYSFTGSLAAVCNPGGPCSMPPGETLEPTPGSASASLEYLNAGEWVSLASIVITAPNILPESTPAPTAFVKQGTFTAVTACWVRLLLRHEQNFVGGTATVAATINLSDFRLTGTDTLAPCAGGNPGGESGGGGEGGDSEECHCNWVPNVPPSVAWHRRTC